MGFSKVQNPASISFKHGFKTWFDLADQPETYLGTLILNFA
jgi:antibiotic biosynthesis monooxygenase (ABM) superfamily enzyme